MLIGIIGRVNTGKSSFFKATTLAKVDISNKVFSTLKPNHGIGYLNIKCPDREFNTECNPATGFCYKGNRFIPIDIIDVPGLMENSHLGAGLGNSFLNALLDADILVQVVDVSGLTNSRGETAQHYNPGNDILMIEKELDEWFFGLCKRKWDALQKLKSEGDAKVEIFAKTFGHKISEEKIKEIAKKKNPETDLRGFSKELRRAAKPMIIAANKIDIPGADYTLSMLQRTFQQYPMIACSAEAELTLKESAKQQLIDYIPGENRFRTIAPLKDNQKDTVLYLSSFLKKYDSTGVQEVLNKAVFSMLGYMPIYMIENEYTLANAQGYILPNVHLVKKGSTLGEISNLLTKNKFDTALSIRTQKNLSKDQEVKANDILKWIT